MATDPIDERLTAFDVIFDELRLNRIRVKPRFVPALRAFVLALGMRCQRALDKIEENPNWRDDPASVGQHEYRRQALAYIKSLFHEVAQPVKRTEFYEIAEDVLSKDGLSLLTQPDPAA